MDARLRPAAGEMMAATSSMAAIVKEITIDAPPEKVFAALTERDQQLVWWHDETHQVESIESDLRIGGKWSMLSVVPRRHQTYGEYRVIDPPRVLEYTWNNDSHEGMGETLVRFELTDTGGKTLLRLTHSGFGNAETREAHDEGWTIVLGWINRYLGAKP